MQRVLCGYSRKKCKKIEEYIRNQLQEDNVRVPCTDECEKAVNGTGGNSDTGKKSVEAVAKEVKICTALGVTLSQFFQEGNSENLTDKQREVLRIWNDLNTNEQETVMFFLCTVERYSIIKSVFFISLKS